MPDIKQITRTPFPFEIQESTGDESDVLMRIRNLGGEVVWQIDNRGRAYPSGDGIFDPTSPVFGAAGDGVADDTAEINGAWEAASAVKGLVYIPAGKRFITSAPLIAKSHTGFIGPLGYGHSFSVYPQIRAQHAGPVIHHPLGTTVDNVLIRGLTITGQAVSGSRGIYIEGDNHGWRLEELFMDTFGDQAVLNKLGFGFFMHDVFAQGGLMVRTGRTAHVGVVETHCHDSHLYRVDATASYPQTPGGYTSGFIGGIVVTGQNCWLLNSVGHFAENGIVLTTDGVYSTASYTRVRGCRAEFNQGPGFVNETAENQIIGNISYQNSETGDGAHSGFLTTGTGAHGSTFIGNVVAMTFGYSKRMKDAYEDSSNASSADNLANVYLMNRYETNAITGQEYNLSGGTKKNVVRTKGADLEVANGGIVFGSPAIRLAESADNVAHMANASLTVEAAVVAREGTFGYKVRIGDAYPPEGGTFAGIQFGDSGETHLYRSAAHTLKTGQDDKFHVGAELEVDGALNHDGSTVGFYNVTPVARPSAYTQTYATATRTHAALTSATLTDNSAGTPDTTIAAMPNPADSPATADALRDDLVANLLPALRNNIADLTAQVNALRADVENAKQVLNATIDDRQADGLAQ